tara:strand:+ start:1081 stop:1353 length:273 start_codon:yes stop_codon:yes gene_type:complete
VSETRVKGYTREEMVEMLRTKVCQVRFIKVNGEERNMTCTLKADQIPGDKKPKDDDNGVQATIGVIKVFDTEKQDWRSFRVDSVTRFMYP